MRLDLSPCLPKLVIDAPIRSLSRWPRRTTIAWVAGLGLAGLAALQPALISAHYLTTGNVVVASAAAGAAGAFQPALSWSPDDPEIHSTLTEAYLHLDQPRKAIDTLERAFQLQLENLLLQQKLAQAFEVGGQMQRADEVLMALGVSAHEVRALGEQARRAKQ